MTSILARLEEKVIKCRFARTGTGECYCPEAFVTAREEIEKELEMHDNELHMDGYCWEDVEKGKARKPKVCLKVIYEKVIG